MHPFLAKSTVLEYAYRSAIGLGRHGHKPGVHLSLSLKDRSEPNTLHWEAVPAGAAAQLFAGAGSGALNSLVCAGTGIEAFLATGNASLAALAGLGAATFTPPAVSAAGSAALSPLAASGGAAVGIVFTAVGTASFATLTFTGAALEAFAAAGSGALPSVTPAGGGAERFSGPGSATLGPLAAAGAALEAFLGSGGGALAPPGTVTPFAAAGSATLSFFGDGFALASSLRVAADGSIAQAAVTPPAVFYSRVVPLVVFKTSTIAVAFRSRVEPHTLFRTRLEPMSPQKLYVGAVATIYTELEVEGTDTDPSGLSIVITPPKDASGVPRADLTFTFGTDANVIKKAGKAGVFKALIDLAYEGTYGYRWVSPGPTAKGVDRGTFDVSA